MARTSSAERQRFWQELFAKRATLGLSVAQVCEEAGVSQATFYAWRKRLQSSRQDNCGGRVTAWPDENGFAAGARADCPRSHRCGSYTDIDRRIAGRGARADSTRLRRRHDSGGVASGLFTGSERAIAVLMFAGTPTVFAYTQPADLRKSFTGLVGIVERELGQTVESGHLLSIFQSPPQ